MFFHLPLSVIVLLTKYATFHCEPPHFEYTFFRDVPYFTKPINEVAKFWSDTLNRPTESIFGQDPKSLWYAKIFPALPDPAVSFDASLHFLADLHDDDRIAPFGTDAAPGSHWSDVQFFSAGDVMKCKSVPDLLDYRFKLWADIGSV